MKRLLVALLVLIIIAAAVTAVGYVPFRMEPGGTYVMYSNTSGWDESPLDPSGFLWRWELLIPRNVELFRFETEPRRFTIETRSVLPSGELYRRYIEGEPRFETRVELDVRYRLKTENLAELAAAGMTPETMEDHLTDLELVMKQDALRAVTRVVESAPGSAEDLMISDTLRERVQSSLASSHPNVNIDAIVPVTIEFPDLDLYRAARNAYFQVQRSRTAALETFAAERARQQATDDRKVEILRRYGEVFAEYPILIEYLKTGSGELSEALDRALSEPGESNEENQGGQ